jgi:hypothetical protein
LEVTQVPSGVSWRSTAPQARVLERGEVMNASDVSLGRTPASGVYRFTRRVLLGVMARFSVGRSMLARLPNVTYSPRPRWSPRVMIPWRCSTQSSLTRFSRRSYLFKGRVWLLTCFHFFASFAVIKLPSFNSPRA